MTFKIDTDIPVPNRYGRANPLKYPFVDMAIGHSFLIHGGGKALHAVRASANRFSKQHGYKFSIHMTNDGIRCWRVE